jgi:hypothetical protein
MSMHALLRRPLAAALELYSKTLRLGADALGDLADALAPGERTGDGAATRPASSTRATAGATRVSARQSAAAPAGDSARHGSTELPAARRDLTDLAKRPAQEVLAALTGLSDEELGELYEIERTGRHRRQVLDAIDATARPQASDPRVVAALVADELDVREPDELVYSTETPGAPA